jgi:hypothetical protein
MRPKAAPTALLAVFALACALYLPTLRASFVDYDDNRNVFANERWFGADAIASVGSARGPANAAGGAVAGRPLDLSWFWTHVHEGLYIPIPYTAWGLLRGLAPAPYQEEGGRSFPFSPAPFHAANVLLHALNAVLVAALLRRITGHPIAAAIGAALFVAHPLQAEPVAWITGFKDLSAGFFSLVAAWLGLRYLLDRPARAAAIGLVLGATAAHAAALLCKPSATTWPLVVLVLAYAAERYRTPKARPDWGRYARLAGPMLCASVALAAVAVVSQPLFPDEAYAPFARLIVPFDALGFYATKLAWPRGLALPYDRSLETVMRHGVRQGLWAIPLAACALLALRHRARWILVCACIVVVAALLPVLGILPYWNQSDATVADRYLYSAMIGPAFALACLWAASTSLWIRLAVPAGLGALAWVTTLQLPIWSDTITLLEHTSTLNDRNVTVHERLGVAYELAGDDAAALRQYERRFALNPEFPKGLLFIARYYDRLGRDRTAATSALLTYLEQARTDGTGHRPRRDPEGSRLLAQLRGDAAADANMWLSAGVHELFTGNPASARAAFTEATRRDPAVVGEINRVAWSVVDARLHHGDDARLVAGMRGLTRLVDAARGLSSQERDAIEVALARVRTGLDLR